MSRILLADDSPHAQRMGELILREEGFEVVSVTDGETALVRLAAGVRLHDVLFAELFGIVALSMQRKAEESPAAAPDPAAAVAATICHAAFHQRKFMSRAHSVATEVRIEFTMSPRRGTM